MTSTISRRNFFTTAGIGVGAAATGLALWKYAPGILSARNRDDRPNILMVTMDTTRYDRIGFNGYHRDTTPNLDKIAEQGVVFHKNYCQAPATVPSISSLMTSKYTGTLGMDVDSILPNSYNTLAEFLQYVGYQTFGVTGVFFLREKQGFRQGFTHFSSPSKPSEGISHSFFTAIRGAKDSVERLSNMFAHSYNEFPNFFWIHFYDAHIPYAAPDEFTKRFKTNGNFDDENKICYGLLRSPDGATSGERAGFGLLSEKEVIKHSDQYDGQILYIDTQIGKLLGFMVDSNLFDLERDLFVLTADHGELLGEKGSFASHHGGYEEVIHVPLFIAGAGLPKGKNIDALTANLDVLPTILELVDIRYRMNNLVGKLNDLDIDGKSLIPIIKGNDRGREYVITELNPLKGVAIRTKEFKLVKRFSNKANLLNEKPIEGFYPSGISLGYKKIEGAGYVLNFRFPYNMDISIYGNAKVFFKLSCSDRNNVKLITEQTFPYFAPSFSLDCPWLSSESKWNKSSGYDYYIWEVKIIRSEDNVKYPLDNILFDSTHHGTLKFKLSPTENFNELFDMVNGPKEEPFISRDGRTVYHDPKYSKVRKELEGKVSYFLLDHNSMLLNNHIQSSDLTDEEREAMKALGYL